MHPHVPQPYELVTVTREDGTEYSGPVFYSLGNFFCNPSQEPLTANGLVGYLSFKKDMVTGKVSFQEAAYVPTYIYRASPLNYRVLPVGYVLDNQSVYDELGVNLKNKLESVWNDADIIGDAIPALRALPAFATGREDAALVIAQGPGVNAQPSAQSSPSPSPSPTAK